MTHGDTTHQAPIQTQTFSVDILTSDHSLLSVAFAVYFSVDASDATTENRAPVPDHTERLVPDVVLSEVSKGFARHTFDDVFSRRRELLESEIVRRSRRGLATYGVRLRDILFSSILPPEPVRKAMAERMRSEQILEAEKNKKKLIQLQIASEKAETKARVARESIAAARLDKKALQLKYIEALEKLALSKSSKVVVLSDGELTFPDINLLKRIRDLSERTPSTDLAPTPY